MSGHLSNTSIAMRAWVILALFAVGLITNTLLDAWKTRAHLRNNHEKSVTLLVESAIGVIGHYHALSQQGVLNDTEAKEQAIAAITAMRFDNGNYIFIGDREGVQLTSGINSLIGKNILHVKDPTGAPFVQKLYHAARNGGGFVDYQWKNTKNNQQLDPKTSYAASFGPWQWVVGSGLNMEALQADIKLSQMNSILNATMILALLSLIIAFFIRSITTPLNKTVQAMKDLSSGDGNLTLRLKEGGSRELAELAHHFNHFVSSIQDIVRNVADAGSQLTGSAEKIATASYSVDSSLNQQKHDAEQLASAITQMASSVEDIVSRTVAATESTSQAARESEDSQEIIQRNMNESELLAQDIHRASDVISRLAEDSRNVDTVLEVIRGIAEQTNLLALNAAIEAARAGDAGRGFAVVADEVRTLSQRTQESTTEIQSIVEKLQTAAEEAVEMMSRGATKASNASAISASAGKALTSITTEVVAIQDMNQHIAASSEEQHTTVRSINNNIISLLDMTNSVANESNHMADASEQLNLVSANIISTINRFRID